jgi:hypothetical protein
VYFYEPLGKKSNMEKLQNVFSTFFCPILLGIFKDISEFKRIKLSRPLQMDGHNCGILTLLFLESFVRKWNLSKFTTSARNMSLVRFYVLYNLATTLA